ncbi:universal stress protein [Cupriavidus plantarum]|uniref:universal stress protein n=1 Tax=Cupriavidus plantarum TaxID=942865 RepID=UPI000E26AACF|nr:universal stress protein [Cupriavidus plantarum]NYH97928.1 nucleotide-binding universal stress UspA family protein [Cupriavidus plantarum]REE92095.1 nucleotide-binding universal stress UspA family protein [Cupriavidus plantarum]RLK35641.1 nucleotide-binding universal stress UspA family protein [Cupriavidus plantarum]
MTQIVLATDGSPFSDEAARFLTRGDLLQPGYTVHVLHVTPDVTGQVRAFVSKDAVEDWHREESEKAMKSVCDILGGANIAFERHALHGFAPDKILAYAKSVNAGAIVMGTHGRGTFFDAVLGSVAGRVLAQAECPVIMIKAEKRPR